MLEECWQIAVPSTSTAFVADNHFITISDDDTCDIECVTLSSSEDDVELLRWTEKVLSKGARRRRNRRFRTELQVPGNGTMPQIPVRSSSLQIPVRTSRLQGSVSKNGPKPRPAGKRDVFADFAPVKGIGLKMLEKMGWNQGQGLGKTGSGIKEPIQVSANYSRKGLLSREEEEEEEKAFREREMAKASGKGNRQEKKTVNHPHANYVILTISLRKKFAEEHAWFPFLKKQMTSWILKHVF